MNAVHGSALHWLLEAQRDMLALLGAAADGQTVRGSLVLCALARVWAAPSHPPTNMPLCCPADLNGFLLQMEQNIADFAGALGCTALQQQYQQLADNRRVGWNGWSRSVAMAGASGRLLHCHWTSWCICLQPTF